MPLRDYPDISVNDRTDRSRAQNTIVFLWIRLVSKSPTFICKKVSL